MARSWGEAAAQGIESGFQMGQSFDAAQEAKRARGVQEARQVKEDDRSEKRLQFEQDRENRIDRNAAADRAATGIQGRNKEIITASTAAQSDGQPVDPALAAEYGKNQQSLAQIRQSAQDYWSRVATGQVDIAQTPPSDLYRNLVVGTGMKPTQLAQMPQHISDVQSGIQTGNQGLVVQGVNGLLQPQLQRGVGDPSPHGDGGTIVRKEIIGLDPAVDANGKAFPNRVIPRLRVYVKGEDGSEKYYDAPMTKDGGTHEDDPVVSLDMAHGMNWMGNVGVLANAVQHPEIAAKIAQGEKDDGGQTDKWLNELRQVSKPATKGATAEKLSVIEDYARKKGLSTTDAAKELQGMGVVSGTAGANTVNAQIAAIQGNDGMTPEEKTSAITDIALGAKGRTTGLVPTVVGKNSHVVGGTSLANGIQKAPIQTATMPKSAGGGKVSTADTSVGPITSGGKTDTGDQTVDFWARAVIAGDKDWQVGLGRSKTGSELIEKVKRRVPELAAEMNLQPQDIGTTRAQSAALSATLKDRTKYSASVDQLNETLEKQAQLVESLMDKGVGPSAVPVFDKWIQNGRKALGDPDIAAFDTAIRGMAREHQRVMTSPLSNAQLHASAADTADQLANKDMTRDQIKATIGVMRQEARNGKTAAHDALEGVTAQMRNLGGARTGAPGSTPGPASATASVGPKAPPAGTVMQGFRFKGGNPADKTNWEPV